MADECLDIVNERSDWTVTAFFTDKDGDPVTPTAASYRLDDEKSRTSIVPSTALTSLSTSKDIEITGDQNYIIKSRKDYEVRILTVEFDYGAGKRGTAEYRYKLKNLRFVVDVPSASLSPSASASPSV